MRIIPARRPEPAAGARCTLNDSELHHVVIIGAGFGGLAVAHQLAGAPVRITVIDQRNHHLFQPLLYQVGTASLATSEIAWPIRHLLRKRKEVTTLLAVVSGIDAARHEVLLEDGATVAFDTLVLATGARHAYFGHDEWESYAPGLKTLEDATSIRRRILLSLERAERETDPERRAALLTFVIVGGGPTGVELAGAIAELAHQNLAADFRRIDTRKTRVRASCRVSRRICLPTRTPPSSAWAWKFNWGLRSANAALEASSMAPIPSPPMSFYGPPGCAPRRPPRGSIWPPTMPGGSGSKRI